VATTALAVDAGNELCVWYGKLTPDQALMQYGFLLPHGPELSGARRGRGLLGFDCCFSLGRRLC